MNRQQPKIFIGTCGYSFLDWQGAFYPEGLPGKKWLAYYTRFFSVVELNVTFYRLPRLDCLRSMAERTPHNFQFWIKVHQDMTHHVEHAEPMYPRFRGCLQPFRESNKLSGVLAQFPHAFKLNAENVEHILRLRNEIPETPLAIEFRHDSWVHDETFAFLRENDMTYTVVDEPDLPHLMPPVTKTTTDIGYIRLHGRNREHWYGSSGVDRYNYDYSREELDTWRERIESMLDELRILYILFNNCHLGRAAKNASTLQDMILGGPSKPELEPLFS